MRKMKTDLTQKDVMEILEYFPDSGDFKWRGYFGGATKANKIAGSLNSKGYITIFIRNKNYLAHRLAWLYMTGEWPEMDIDHIDMDRKNNVFSNLRKASLSQNRFNQKKPKNNTSGYKGVCFAKDTKKWQAQIKKSGKTYYLGQYNTPEDAYEVYCKAAKENHGEFARTA